MMCLVHFFSFSPVLCEDWGTVGVRASYTNWVWCGFCWSSCPIISLSIFWKLVETNLVTGKSNYFFFPTDWCRVVSHCAPLYSSWHGLKRSGEMGGWYQISAACWLAEPAVTQALGWGRGGSWLYWWNPSWLWPLLVRSCPLIGLFYWAVTC